MAIDQLIGADICGRGDKRYVTKFYYLRESSVQISSCLYRV